MTLVKGLRFDNLRGDIFGGLTAAVVALPLALAFGVASGAGPMAGLYGAICVGLFAALFGGTPCQVSGPTGPMTVVMAGVISQYSHDFSLAFTVVMMGGVLQILFGVFRFGGFIRLMPFPVISGFMSGIGCIIVILQIAPLFGHGVLPGGPTGAIVAFPETVSAPVADALIVGLIALGVVYLTPKRLARFVPPPLLALIVGSAAAALMFGGAPILGDIPSGLPSPQLPHFTVDALPGMIGSAMVLAVLGSIDSLLTSLIADNLTRTHHDSNRELIGQGIGNLVAGVIGGIPGAGATMRTVVNLRAGGATPISGALHALVLLAIVLGLGTYARHIPHAVLAGILIKVGIDIIDWAYIRRILAIPRASAIIMTIVLVLTVTVDLIVAVGVGVVIASLLFVKRMSDLQLASVQRITGEDDPVPIDDEERRILVANRGSILAYHFGGPISFGAAQGIVERLSHGNGERGNSERALVLDMSGVPMIDGSGSLAIEDVAIRAAERGTRVYLCGLRPPIEAALRRIGLGDTLPEGQWLESRIDALRAAVAAVGEEAPVSAPELPASRAEAQEIVHRKLARVRNGEEAEEEAGGVDTCGPCSPAPADRAGPA